MRTPEPKINASKPYLAQPRCLTTTNNEGNYTCICRLTTSRGYVIVCPNKPATDPQASFGIISFLCSSGT